MEHEIDIGERFSRLKRNSAAEFKQEQVRTVAPGTIPPGWAIEVVSLDQYNVYNVRQVHIGTPGTAPSQISFSETKAFNIAESFLVAGQLSPGTYAIMWRCGEVNVFYVTP